MSSETQLSTAVTSGAELQGRPNNTLRMRGAVDTLIIGVFIALIVIYVNELSLAIPCRGFSFSECRLPSYAQAFWGTYFKIDPLFFQGADWYVATMRLQDFLFNPWWMVSLVMFWTGRQETRWYKTATIVICGLMLGTTAIAFQVWSLHYTAPFIVALILVNGPYAVFAILLTLRLRHRPPGYVRPAPRSISTVAAIALLVTPTIVYVLISMAATAIVPL
jgi:uncharacterized membrane protein YhaH (DUF805 family)